MDRYLRTDRIGSTRYLSDYTGNNFPGMLRYDAFGGRSATGGSDGHDPTPSQFAGDFGYQTEYASGTEPGAGLQYLDQRYYDPAVARFITADPIGFAAGLNRYGYAGDDPVNGADPSGLDWDPVVDGAVLSVDTYQLLRSGVQHDGPAVAGNTLILLADAALADFTPAPPAAVAERALAAGEAVERTAAGIARAGSRPYLRGIGQLALGALARNVYFAKPTVEEGCPGSDAGAGGAGPYDHLPEPRRVGEGKDFTPA